MEQPVINPLRFVLSTEIVDNSTIFPTIYNQKIGTNYYSDELNINYIREHLVNNALQIQVRSNYSPTFDVYKDGAKIVSDTSLDLISIEGWVSTPVFLLSYIPTSTGVYYFVIKENGDEYVSDLLNVFDPKKDIVKIQYQNEINDFGLIFWQDGSDVFDGQIFFTGKKSKSPSSASSKSVYTGNRGVSEVVNASPVTKYQVILDCVHQSYIECLETLFCCNMLTIDGLSLSCVDEIKPEVIEGTDCFKVTIELINKTVDYLTK